MDQAKLGKETQFALREKEDEARRWRKLHAEATGGGKEGGDAEAEGTEDGDGEEGAGALGVDERVKLRAEVRRRGRAEGGCTHVMHGRSRVIYFFWGGGMQRIGCGATAARRR